MKKSQTIKIQSYWITLIILLGGFLMRLVFILKCPWDFFQNDWGEYGFTAFEYQGEFYKAGHPGYIWYFVTHNHLPDFDVRMVQQFYHPPLHHILEALWLRLLMLFGVSGEPLYEATQVLPFLYSCIALTVFACILHELHLKNAAFWIPLGILAFHPTFTFLAGSINNDMLSIMFMILALWFTIRWSHSQRMSDILGIALSIGLGMSAKLSAWMAAPAAAFVFLQALKKAEKKSPLLKQFVVFGIVCVPLGLWWSVRNFLLYDVPIGFIPTTSVELAFIDVPEWKRVLGFSLEQFKNVYVNYLPLGDSFNDYNPLTMLLKTSLFEMYVNDDTFPHAHVWSIILFWMHVLLVALCSIGAASSVFKKQENAKTISILSTTYAVTLMSYYAFCLSFPAVCTENIRYATGTIYCILPLTGLWLQSEKSGILKRAICIIAPLFCILSFLEYSVVL